jgi:hypothetical protein
VRQRTAGDGEEGSPAGACAGASIGRWREFACPDVLHAHGAPSTRTGWAVWRRVSCSERHSARRWRQSHPAGRAFPTSSSCASGGRPWDWLAGGSDISSSSRFELAAANCACPTPGWHLPAVPLASFSTLVLSLLQHLPGRSIFDARRSTLDARDSSSACATPDASASSLVPRLVPIRTQPPRLSEVLTSSLQAPVYRHLPRGALVASSYLPRTRRPERPLQSRCPASLHHGHELKLQRVVAIRALSRYRRAGLQQSRRLRPQPLRLRLP